MISDFDVIYIVYSLHVTCIYNYRPFVKCPFMAYRLGRIESGMYEWFRVWGCTVWLGVNMTTECNWGSALLFA